MTDSHSPQSSRPTDIARAYLAWCESGDDNAWGWAESHVFALSHDDPEALWQVVLALVPMADSESRQREVGGGPLESLLREHPSFADRIAEQAQLDPAFMSCLLHTWPENMQFHIWRWLMSLHGKTLE